MTTFRRASAPRLTPRESLLFEAGIKLGGVFHQYLGIPLSEKTAGSLARAIEEAVGLQPFVREVRVRIRPERGGPVGRGRYAYRYLTPDMLEVRVRLRDGPAEVEALLVHRPDLKYPLMKVVRLHERKGGAVRRARALRRPTDSSRPPRRPPKG